MNAPHHLCIAPSESSAPVFPPDGREAGALFDAAGSQRCGGRQPGMAGYGHPASPMCPPTESSAPVFPSDGREAGALVLGCCSVSCGDIQPGRAAVCDILPGPAESKNRQPLTHSGKQGLPAFVLGFLPHRGRGIGGLSPGWPGASCSDTGSCSVRYKPVHRHLFPPRGSCVPADRCPASGGFPPG